MRNAYVDHDRKLLVCWAPKCACTAISHWFALGLLGKTKESLVKKSLHPRAWLAQNNYLIRSNEIISCMQQGYHCIAFTRDPFDRAVSAYVSKFVFRTGKRQKILKFEDLEEFAQIFYLQAKGVNPVVATYNFEGISFNEYMDYIVEKVLNPGRADINLDHHWNTQMSPSWVEKKIKHAEYWDVHEFKEGIGVLNDRYNCNYIPEVLNKLNYDLRDSISAPDRSSCELARLNSLPGPGCFMTPKTIAKVRLAYSIDYVSFGYSSGSGLNSLSNFP